MKKRSKHADVSVPQTVTEFIKVHNGQETIQFGFTDQRISAHAGLSAFATFLHRHRFGALLKNSLPPRTSPNATAPEDLALGFMTAILAGAKKLAQVAHLRRDPLLPGLLGIKGVGSQSTFSRFFAGFIISRTAGYTTIRLSVRQGRYRDWWRRVLEKLSCPFHNCVAVERLQPNWSG